MADEYTAEPGDRRDGAGIGRESDAFGPEDISEGPLAQELRDADAEMEAMGQRPDAAGNDGESRGDSGKGEDPSASERPAGDGFYKSQEEVDRAFGRRLASERRRWERAHQEALRQVHAESEDQRGKEGDTWLPQQGMYEQEYTYFSDLVTQANALSKNRSGFDLMEELNENAAFERMVANGVPVSEAYEIAGQATLAEREQSIRQDERHRMMEEIESRTQSLPPVDHTAGLSGPALDVTRMSEEELTRLAERVRKGERVVI